MPQVDKKLKGQIRTELWKILGGYVDVYSEAEVRAYEKREKDLIQLLATHTQQVREELIGLLDKKIKYNNREATLTLSLEASKWHREKAETYAELRKDILTALGGEE